ncbi:MAG: 50S ribosomal protein L22 [Candidatus Gracilibacteria bacterium]|jgi:large subunit ribosomal protein L22
MKSILRNARTSPTKVNLVAKLVRGKDAKEAVALLHHIPRKGAKILAKVIESAMANAENNFKQDKTTLFIKEIVINDGIMFKRSIMRARGKSTPILKRNAHITVKLDVKENAVAKKEETPPQKPAKKTSKKLTTSN